MASWEADTRHRRQDTAVVPCPSHVAMLDVSYSMSLEVLNDPLLSCVNKTRHLTSGMYLPLILFLKYGLLWCSWRTWILLVWRSQVVLQLYQLSVAAVSCCHPMSFRSHFPLFCHTFSPIKPLILFLSLDMLTVDNPDKYNHMIGGHFWLMVFTW